MSELLEILLFLICLLLLFLIFTAKNPNGVLPTNWPLLGMLPGLLFQLRRGRLHDWCAKVGDTVHGTLIFKGPWFFFLNTDMLFTADPSNVHHIMVSNFVNFHKGPEFKEIFDILGDGIFNSDLELWRVQRRVALSLVNHKSFLQFLIGNIRHKVQTGLVPVLDHVWEQGLVLDLQDLFQRFAFDAAHMLVTGRDPGSLSIEFPELAFSKAMDAAWEAIFYRHIVPNKIWKLQRWLGIGAEKKLKEAWGVLDQIIAEIICTKKQELLNAEGINKLKEDDGRGMDMLTSFMSGEDCSVASNSDDKSLKDAIVNFMLAGRDAAGSALTWFFWLLSNNPHVETKIREEIKATLPPPAATEGERIRQIMDIEKLKKLVYLQGAINEALRLYPPIPFEHKSPIKEDTLPSGHKVHPKMKILFSLYAMGRMSSIWGKDCLEFRPERWISERGGARHEPSHKFFVFSAGPRSCIGKEVALIQLKAVIASIIHRGFRFEVVGGQDVMPNVSIILQIKHGLKVKVVRNS